MDRNKRESKPPEAYIIPAICYPRIRKKKQKKKPVTQAQYQLIPAPLKFVYTQKVFFFYADLVLTEIRGSLMAETSMMNKFVTYPEITVKPEKDYKIITIDVQRKDDCALPPWQYQVEKLLESESPELKEWGKRLRLFCLKHEDMMRSVNSGNSAFAGLKMEHLTQLAHEAEARVSRLFSKYPCLMFTTSLTAAGSRMKQITLNEKYINEVGYSIDSLITNVLQEGMPRMLPLDTACSAKMLVESFYNVEGNKNETPDIISDLPLKKGFNKKIRYKIHYVGEFKDDGYDLHGVVTLLGKEDDVHKDFSEGLINKKFVRKMISKEKEANKFLQKYYDDQEATHSYANIDKVCLIKEIGRSGSE